MPTPCAPRSNMARKPNPTPATLTAAIPTRAFMPSCLLKALSRMRVSRSIRGIYDLVTQISREYNNPIIEITECGCCYMDSPFPQQGGRIPDVRRIAFFRGILTELARAIKDGARVRSFHAWSLLDNFEWTDGYSQRYGLTWVDYRDQSRTIKDSGHWYGSVASQNRIV